MLSLLLYFAKAISKRLGPLLLPFDQNRSVAVGRPDCSSSSSQSPLLLVIVCGFYATTAIVAYDSFA